MSDSYQPIYDAVRSRISPCDVASVLREAASSGFDLGYQKQLLQEQIGIIGYEMSRPSVVFRPTLTKDGNAWLAVLGDIPSGVVGCGESPAQAMEDFDKKWFAKH